MRDILVGLFAIGYGYLLYKKYPGLCDDMSRSYRSFVVTNRLAVFTLFLYWIVGVALLWLVLYVFHMTLPAFVVVKLVG